MIERCKICDQRYQACRCAHFNGLVPEAEHPSEETLTSSASVAAREHSYTYDDMLAAWVAGKENERKYGSGEGDAPDFATWIKLRAATDPRMGLENVATAH